MRIVHTSDWHIGRSLNGYSLLEDQRYFLNWLSGVLREQKADALLVSGDVYNTAAPSGAAVRLLDDFLSGTILDDGVPVFLIAGNHDSAERLRFSSRLLEREGLYISSGLEEGVRQIELSGVAITLLPYIQPADVRPLFPDESVGSFDRAVGLVAGRYLRPRPGCVNILAAHGFYLNFGGAQPVCCDSELHVGGSEAVDLTRFSGFDYVALGHLHGAQRAGEHARYSGSPLKYSVSEAAHQKQLLLLDLQPGRPVEVTPLPVAPLRDLRVLKGPLEQLLGQPSDDYVSVQLTDRQYLLDGMRRLRRAFPHLLEMQYVNLKLQNPERLAGGRQQPPEELFEDFYRQATGGELDSEQKQLLQKVLREVQDEAD